MTSSAHRPTPTPVTERANEARPRRSATHDYWPRDFWDIAPETGTEARPGAGDISVL